MRVCLYVCVTVLSVSCYSFNLPSSIYCSDVRIGMIEPALPCMMSRSLSLSFNVRFNPVNLIAALRHVYRIATYTLQGTYHMPCAFYNQKLMVVHTVRGLFKRV